jgi:2,3-bisphosphoglycerate-independent phosphoglycerate mutase
LSFMRILFLFFDGWGLGANNPATNPFLVTPMPTLRELFDGVMPTLRDNGGFHSARATLVPTDATLGVPGLPQSATGQTTIFTGVNAPREIGEHLGPYPNAALRKILTRDNLFKRLTTAHRRVAFANAYPPIFFERLARNKARRTATSYAVHAADVRYRDIDDLRTGRAVSAFVTNEIWREHGADVPLITAHDAGKNLARLAHENDLTVFEYFLTDAAGHKANTNFTARVLAEVDELLRGVLDEINLDDSLVVTTSDHGNVEDALAKGHTLNPVPTILIGAGRAEIAPQIHSLTDLTPAISNLLLAI